MIVTANENYINVIMNLSAEDPFACRIISQYNSYDSSLAFVDYWTIIDLSLIHISEPTRPY